MNTLHSIQAARGIAAMAVAAFHLTLLMAEPRYGGAPVFGAWTSRGNLGVDFFFVLSGFIILMAHHREIGRPEALANYFRRRIVRLFPTYWVYTAVFCALVFLGFGAASTVPTTAGEWFSTIFLVRISSFEMPITPAWTLVHEWGFYVIFGVLIFNRTLGFVALAAWLIPALFVFSFPEEGQRDWVTTYFSPLNLNFLAGMAVFLAFQHGSARLGKLALPLGIILFAGVFALERSGQPYAVCQIPFAIALALIVLGLASWERAGIGARAGGILSLIGDASYSIYLTHLAVMGVLLKLTFALGNHVPLPLELVYVAVFFSTIVAGYLAYVLVERTLLSVLRRPRRAPLRDRLA